jgi:hypothetical protein
MSERYVGLDAWMAHAIDLRSEWSCPNCPTTALLPTPKPGQTHLHTCSGLRGLTAPLIPAGMRAKVEAVEREDYVGHERVQLDPERQRPVMAVHTTRDEGEDVLVFAPTARST